MTLALEARKDCRPVHAFALFKSRAIVPVDVIVPPESPDPAVIEETVPLPVPPPVAVVSTTPPFPSDVKTLLTVAEDKSGITVDQFSSSKSKQTFSVYGLPSRLPSVTIVPPEIVQPVTPSVPVAPRFEVSLYVTVVDAVTTVASIPVVRRSGAI